LTASARRSGRRPGDSGTREAILEAARRLFAEQGYDRTSMRAIALEAGVDPALVSHYHASKQALFVASVELPFDPSEVLPGILHGDRESIGLRLATFLVGVLESEEGRRRITGLVRAAASEPEAARMMRELLTREVLATVVENLGSDDPQRRASFTSSQIMGLVMARYIVGVEPLASLPADEVVRVIGPTLQRYLIEPL
jgi:AcrR family transcriptional regulator